jgi:SAM-dependent methyltransferase
MKGNEIRYPIFRETSFFDKLAIIIKHLPLKCIVCNRHYGYKVTDTNLRESCYCRSCGSSNRQRQISYVLIKSLLNKNPAFSSIKSFVEENNISVYNTESRGAVHDVLRKMKNYTSSEYFGIEHASGDYVDGVLHQDLQNVSFDDSRFDVVLSTEVFEHIPDAYKAFKEVHRILKHGGRHIFTVPFDARSFKDSVKAVLEPSGTIQYLAEPEYHPDVVRPGKGILVYRIFSLEMMVKLNEIGFTTNLYHLYSPYLGILGNNALVFESIKTG